MPSRFRVGVVVPVTDEATAAIVTQRLQEATTIQKHIGAWVVRRHQDDPFPGQVLVDFTIEADTLEEARARALAWTRAELARGRALAGVGEPADAGAAAS
jgi:hypothetical protein